MQFLRRRLHPQHGQVRIRVLGDHNGLQHQARGEVDLDHLRPAHYVHVGHNMPVHIHDESGSERIPLRARAVGEDRDHTRVDPIVDLRQRAVCRRRYGRRDGCGKGGVGRGQRRGHSEGGAGKRQYDQRRNYEQDFFHFTLSHGKGLG